jgi:hypothetical protein
MTLLMEDTVVLLMVELSTSLEDREILGMGLQDRHAVVGHSSAVELPRGAMMLLTGLVEADGHPTTAIITTDAPDTES